MTNEILCPKCGSNQVSANKRGYSVSKGIGGLLVPGGLLWGFQGSKRVDITCLKCGHKFKPGEGATSIKDFKNKKSQQGEVSKADIINKKLLQNQLEEFKQKKEQKFYKAYIFKTYQYIDIIKEIKNPILKSFFINVYLENNITEIEHAQQTLEEISDKKEVDILLNTIKKQTSENQHNLVQYNKSIFPEFIEQMNKYNELDKIQIKEPLKPKDSSDFSIYFYLTLVTFLLIVILIVIFKDKVDSDFLLTFLVIIGIVLIILFLGGLFNLPKALIEKFKYKKAVDKFNIDIESFNKKQGEIESNKKNLHIPELIEKIQELYPEYNHLIEEINKIENNFKNIWGQI